MEALDFRTHGFTVSGENATNYSAVNRQAILIFLWQVLNINHFNKANVVDFNLAQIITIIFDGVDLNRVHVLEKSRVVELNVILKNKLERRFLCVSNVFYEEVFAFFL